MNTKSLFIFAVALIGCNHVQDADEITTSSPTDNLVLIELAEKDQFIRKLDEETDTVILEKYDRKHRNAVFELLAAGAVKTPMDKYRAALILQHTAGKMCEGELTSISPENFLLAYQLSSSAWGELEAAGDSATIYNEAIPRMVALNMDRYLLYTEGYQKFGTQFVFDDQAGDFVLAPIDTCLCTDADRIKHQVEPLFALLQKYQMKPLPNQQF